jgi:phage baseplate assembly protein W
MIKRLYNTKTVASRTATVSSDSNNSFTYRGFSSAETNKNFKLFDIDLVKQDLINHFYIRKGEKLQNPEFGTVIWDMLFEQFTEEVKNIIAKDVEAIVNYDPRMLVTQVLVDTTDQGIQISVDLTYLPFNINESMTLNFDKNNSIIN